MTRPALRIATRSSDLAIWQAEHVASLLRATDSGCRIELVPVTTHADRRLDLPIAEIGGKAVFAKEVQHAVLDGRADLAVHSAKDLTAVTAEGLLLAAVPTRGDVRDALAGARLDDLAPGAVVGTGSARRRVQLAARRPDIEIVGIRGNIATRLGHLDHLDAIVVAAAGLQRLGLADRATQIFDPDQIVPQVGQGALGVECRSDDSATAALLRTIEDPRDRLTVDAERAFLARLGGDCDLPAGAHATLIGGKTSAGENGLRIVGVLAADRTAGVVRRQVQGDATPQGALAAGTALADELLDAVSNTVPDS